ncbi:uncharacterized protein MONOS_7673 [Monocercomonoides exilis]|uniref:uncharacterized protein n=1 Tax=Monocercomonoides exilis TaxID=2049356 RepID=UPI00355A842C|nr:hypothetical protein MONOS_7673 [Monocercomonoides exilis]|eukprot:MONOS_7673.1-p1 / transcript=MONOS_7673.1 / gene=MONOS_7673 / organism=Monocercomonoides_exilis_PA203 / gene_product=unspecified product / transcript_product=unspecified product / location=Mono_scaffold00268:33090-33783(-) / protein_length=207 / sequence_SO=supercontig / SO=protein_coding / is_pseudo=false
MGEGVGCCGAEDGGCGSVSSSDCAVCARGARRSRGRRKEKKRWRKEGEEKGKEDGGREGGDRNEEKGGYPTAHREFVERIKENQGKLEEAMAPLIVKALGLSGLRFVKAEVEVGADKQHSVEPEVCSSSPSDGIQQENRRAKEEEAADGSLGITFDESSDGAVKDVEQMQMPMNGLTTNEEKDISDEEVGEEEEEMRGEVERRQKS